MKCVVVNAVEGAPDKHGVTSLERAIQEAAVCTSLVHPNVVRACWVSGKGLWCRYLLAAHYMTWHVSMRLFRRPYMRLEPAPSVPPFLALFDSRRSPPTSTT